MKVSNNLRKRFKSHLENVRKKQICGKPDAIVINRRAVYRVICIKMGLKHGMCMLELSKVPVYKFQYDYIKENLTRIRNYYSKILATWCMKLKLEMFMTILVRIKNFLISVIILLCQNIMMIQKH